MPANLLSHGIRQQVWLLCFYFFWCRDTEETGVRYTSLVHLIWKTKCYIDSVNLCSLGRDLGMCQ